MKRFLYVTLSFMLLSVLISSCSKDDATPTYVNELPEKLIAPYVIMKIDGQWWVSDSSNPKLANIYTYSQKMEGVTDYIVRVNGISTNHFAKENSALQMGFAIPSAPKVGTYSLPLKPGNYTAFYQFDTGEWVRENSTTTGLVQFASNGNFNKTGLPFTVKISKITEDKIQKNKLLISGTFEGQLKRENGTIVKITEGKFVGE